MRRHRGAGAGEGSGLALLHEAGAAHYIVRLAKNATSRRATPAPYGGRGQPQTQGRAIPAATPADQVETWREGDVLLRAEVWREPVLPDAADGSPPVA